MVQTRIKLIDSEEQHSLPDNTRQALEMMSDNIDLFLDNTRIDEWLEYERELRNTINHDDTIFDCETILPSKPYIGVLNNDGLRRYMSTTIDMDSNFSGKEEDCTNSKIDLILIKNDDEITRHFDNDQWNNIRNIIEERMKKYLYSNVHIRTFNDGDNLIEIIAEIKNDIEPRDEAPIGVTYDEILKVRSVHLFSPPDDIDYNEIKLVSSFSSCVTNCTLNSLPQCIVANHIIVRSIDIESFGLFISNFIKQISSIEYSTINNEPLLRTIMYNSSRKMEHAYLGQDGNITMNYKELSEKRPEPFVPNKSDSNRLLKNWDLPNDWAMGPSNIMVHLDIIDFKRTRCRRRFQQVEAENVRDFWENERSRRRHFLKFLCELANWGEIPDYNRQGYENDERNGILLWDLWRDNDRLDDLRQSVENIGNVEVVGLRNYRHWMGDNHIRWSEYLDFFIDSHDCFAELWDLVTPFAHSEDENQDIARFEEVTRFQINNITLNALNDLINDFLKYIITKLEPNTKCENIRRIYSIVRKEKIRGGDDVE